ncbi:MAG: hypothetical protein ACJAYU_002592 [Bradymonadia bacterium]|jgi:hypothetical protein
MRFLVFLLFSCAACGGAPPSTDNLRAALRLSAELGPLEAEALELTEGLTSALADEVPAASRLDELERYVSQNSVRMHEVAAELGDKFAALPGAEHVAYQQVVSEYLSDATFGWLDACVEFIAEEPELEERLRDIVEPLGPLRISEPDED